MSKHAFIFTTPKLQLPSYDWPVQSLQSLDCKFICGQKLAFSIFMSCV